MLREWSYCGQCRMCVRLNEFVLPIQARKKTETDSKMCLLNCYTAPINRPCSNSPSNPSEFFFSFFYSLMFDWPWLTTRAQTLTSSIKHVTEEPKGFSFFYLSHVWIVSKAGIWPQHPEVNHCYQSKPVHHWYDDQTVECHRLHTRTVHTHTAPAVRQLRKNMSN